MRVRLNETFVSPQGEGTWAGIPMFFVRFFGCNLVNGNQCPWCDTPTALTTSAKQREYELDTFEIVELITKCPVSIPVCFTGGEPLHQHQALEEIMAEVQHTDEVMALGKPVEKPRMLTVETNGSIYVPLTRVVLPALFLSISPKFTNVRLNGRLEAHGEVSIKNWLMSGGIRKHLKFVVTDEEQFSGILNWLSRVVEKKLREDIDIYLQPEYSKGRENYGKIISKYTSDREAWDEVSALGFKSVRFTTQQHKTLAVR